MQNSTKTYVKRCLFAAFVSIGLAASSTSVSAQPDSFADLQKRISSAGHLPVIVLFKAEESQTNEAHETGWQNLNNYIRAAQKRGLEDVGWANFNDIVKFDLFAGVATNIDAQRLQQLQNAQSVAAVYVDERLNTSLTKSVYASNARGTHFTEEPSDGWSVAIVDTGVDANHPMLKGRVIKEACFSTTRTFSPEERLESLCPNQEDKAVGTGAAKPCANECSHGTHVAGIAAGDNGSVSGIAPKSPIVAVQAFSRLYSPDCPHGECITAMTSDIIRALEWLYKIKSEVKLASVNMSLGHGEYTDTCDDETALARIASLFVREDIAIVAASGNDGFRQAIASPACLSNILSVGAVDYQGKLANFSNWSKYIDIHAPGTDAVGDDAEGIYSAVPGGQFARKQGTSMAAPHVAGAIAAIKSRHPNFDMKTIISALEDNARQTGGRRVLDVEATLAALTTKTVTPEPEPDAVPAPAPEPEKQPAEPATPKPAPEDSVKQPSPTPTPAPSPSPTPKPAPKPAFSDWQPIDQEAPKTEEDEPDQGYQPIH